MERRLESSQRSSRSSPWTGFCSVWWVGKVRFNCASRSRTSKRGSGCRCPTRRSSCSSHLDTWTFISSSPLESDSHSPWMRQSWRQSEQFHSFQREGELGSWVHARRAPHMAVGGGVWTVFSLCFSDSVHFGRRVLAPRELFESPRWPTVVGRRRLALLIELVVTCHHGHLAPLTIVRNNNKDNRENKDNKDSKDNKAMHISQACPCLRHLFLCLHVRGSSSCHRDGSREEAAAKTQTVASARTSERRNRPGRVTAPYLTRSEDGKGRGGGARGARRVTTTEAPSSPGVLPVVR